MADKCRSCGADVIWATKSDGKKLPLDAKPITGPLYSTIGEGGETACARVDRLPPGQCYRSHFETCPDAKQWTKPKAEQLPIDEEAAAGGNPEGGSEDRNTHPR